MTRTDHLSPTRWRTSRARQVDGSLVGADGSLADPDGSPNRADVPGIQVITS